MMRARFFRARCLRTCGFLIGVLTVSLACQRRADPSADFGASAAATPGDALPPLELRDETSDLLLTWLGPDGDFHVVEKIGDVPAEHRQQVRVVQTSETAGTGAL